METIQQNEKEERRARSMSSSNQRILAILADSSLPWELRAVRLREALQNITPETQQMVQRLLQGLNAPRSEAVYRERLRKLDALLKEMEEQPRRQAVFIELRGRNGRDVSSALVMLEDGTLAYTVVPNEEVAGTLRRGDRVILEGKGRALLEADTTALRMGEEAKFERAIDDRHLEVTTRRDERVVVLAAENLMGKIKAGEVLPGADLVFGPRLGIAFGALPSRDGLSHFKFLEKGGVPEVRVERDIGAPPKVIAEAAAHLRQELTKPEARRRYNLRRCTTKLLCGVSGSGKTLAIQAIHRLMYEIMSEVTGVSIEQLPPRVFRFRQSQVLSKWLGESDKNVDRFFDEIETVAGEPFPTPDGRQVILPVLAIIEEADGLGRARGEDAVYDRILTTALQRLDPNREGLKDKLIIFLATTNEPHIVDAAFLRRVGASIEVFGRLNRTSFRAVLQKHIRGLPAASRNGSSQEELWRQFVNDLTAWLFSPNATDPGLVELTFAGSTTPVVKHRRDFLTGALVDRAVQQAANEACQAECGGLGSPGVSFEQLVRAFDDQIRGVVSQLREENVSHYTDLPDGVRVAMLRRIPQASHLSVEYQNH